MFLPDPTLHNVFCCFLLLYVNLKQPQNLKESFLEPPFNLDLKQITLEDQVQRRFWPTSHSDLSLRLCMCRLSDTLGSTYNLLSSL